MVVTTAGIAMEIPMAGISRILVASCSLHTEYTAMLCRIDRDVSNTHYQPGGMASGNEFKSASLSTRETHMNSYGYNSGSDQQQYNNIRFIVPGQYCLQSVQGNTLDKDPAEGPGHWCLVHVLDYHICFCPRSQNFGFCCMDLLGCDIMTLAGSAVILQRCWWVVAWEGTFLRIKKPTPLYNQRFRLFMH